MKEVAIVAAVRSPVGKAGGMLAGVDPFDLTAPVLNEAVRRAGIQAKELDEVLFSCLTVPQIDSGRTYALYAGIPQEVPGMMMHRGCGSTITSTAIAASMIKSGMGSTYLVGGMESNSNGAYLMEKPKKGFSMAPPKFLRSYITAPNYEYGDEPMGITAENVAEMYGITREECDAFALESQRKAETAWSEGFFDDQVLPYQVKIGKEIITMQKDETVRASSMEALGKLRPALKDNGVCTAGNSSPVCDGASALVIMDKEKAESLGLTILATVKDYVVIGREPHTMGLGPVFATKKIFERNHFTFNDIDFIELNEAFAAQVLGCYRLMDWPQEKINIHGGAIALGHPTGATGGMLITKSVYEFRRSGAQRALITFCIGSGQGVAMILENNSSC